MLASQENSPSSIKYETFASWNTLSPCQLNETSVDQLNSYEEFKHLVQCYSDIKTEEVSHGILLTSSSSSSSSLESLSPIKESRTPEDPASSSCRNATTHHGLENRKDFSCLQTRSLHGLLMAKKLLLLSVPKKHVYSRWTKRTTESILTFLKSFVTFAQGSNLTLCGDRSLALKGPRILKCEECFLEFFGLYDRYLKLFMHYKTSHKRCAQEVIKRTKSQHLGHVHSGLFGEPNSRRAGYKARFNL